jgi:hypothetical protein
MSRGSIYKTVVACAFLLLGLQAASAANDLQSIGVTRDGDSVVVTVKTNAACEYNVFLTEGKPERIVIDLTGVTNNLPEKQFSNLPLRSIHSIRTSQYKTSPELQARVVLDIRRPIEFRNYRDGNSIIVKIPALKDETRFADWSSGGNNNEVYKPAVAIEGKTIPEKIAIATKEKAVPEKKVAEKLVVEEKPAQVENVKVEPVERVEKPEVKVEKITPPPVEQPVEKTPIAPTQLAIADTPVPPPGVQVDTTPKRKIVEYTANTSHDPFTPLVGAGAGKITEGLPSLENLKLVGILEDTKLNRALLEDAEGNGYILKPNDRVQSGYLVTVTENKAIFQITEYGWTRTVALELEIPDIK